MSAVVTRSGSPTMAFKATSIAASLSSCLRPRIAARGADSPGRGLLKQTAVVVPPNAADLVAEATSARRWVWGSTPPGKT
jgi:hypothetical protein